MENKMNKIVKTILIVITVLVVLSSVGLNLYTFGVSWINTKINSAYQQGAIEMRNAVYEAVNKGEIQISDKEGKNVITVIKK